EHVDLTRDAAAVRDQVIERGGGEDAARRPAPRTQPAVDILAHLGRAQRLEQRARADALIEAVPARLGQARDQLRLADQDDLQAPLLERVGVREQAQALE